MKRRKNRSLIISLQQIIERKKIKIISQKDSISSIFNL